jgi:PAS domain S-box-containing protein
MKYSVSPTQNELVMRDQDFIVSKTDLKGRITYANRIFIEFAGYDEKELLGAQHNIVRHPDMPRGVFKLLWDTIQSGHEIFAYVKNMSKDGSFYWVLANVTPVLDESNAVVGYNSVRRKPKKEALVVIEKIYGEMLTRERNSGTKDAVQASVAYLTNLLNERKVSYEEFILGL